MNAYLIGDVHGIFKQPEIRSGELVKGGTFYQQILSQINGFTIQIGDMGIMNQQDRESLDFLRPTDWFYQGNHDSRKECNKHPQCLGNWGQIDWLPYPCMFFSGAASTDAAPLKDSKGKILIPGRTPGVDWFADEELDPVTMDEAIQAYSEIKPDVVLSHDCPQSIWGLLKFKGSFPWYKFSNNRTSIFLDTLFAIHKPKLWCFGHHHMPCTHYVDGTKFRCIDELEVFPLVFPM